MAFVSVFVDFGLIRQRMLNLSNKLGNPDLLPRAMAVNTTTEMKFRIFTKSELANGRPIKNGKGYSGEWALVRQKKGRQIAYIDLQFTGEMFISMTTIPLGDGYGIGFTRNSAAVKAAKNERLFGKIFTLNPNEEKRAISTAFELTKQIINANR